MVGLFLTDMPEAIPQPVFEERSASDFFFDFIKDIH